MRYVIILFLMIYVLQASATERKILSFTEFYGKKLEETKPVTLDILDGKKALIALWRSDCAPCLVEIAAWPKIAEENPDLPIFLISLQDEVHARKHLPLTFPKNVRLLIAKDDGKEVFKAFGAEMPMLPFSVSLHADGSVCQQQYGLLNGTTVKLWNKTC